MILKWTRTFSEHLKRFSPSPFSPSLQYYKTHLSNSFTIMFNLRQLIILITVSLALAENFQLDCQITPAVCNHVCYSINCKKSKFVLNYDSNAANQHRRSLDSGCALQNNPCGMTKGLSFNNFCSEYPYASAAQGGKGAIMRCVTESEYNSKSYNIVLNNQIAIISFAA